MYNAGSHKYLDDHCRLLLSDLKKIKQAVPEELRSLFQFTPPILSMPVLGRFGWWVSPSNSMEFNIPKLRLFHYLLKHHGWISCPYEEFELHFINDENFWATKIIWTGDLMILVLLFDILINKHNVIPPTNNLYNILCGHFEWLDKNNNVIKPSVENLVSNFTYLLLGEK
jgi:hypothetical protein